MKVSKNNIKIIDSYLIKDSLIMEDMISEGIDKGFETNRGMLDMINEWRAHNLLYDLHIARSHTKDVDIESEIPKYLNMIYTILGSIYNKKER